MNYMTIGECYKTTSSIDGWGGCHYKYVSHYCKGGNENENHWIWWEHLVIVVKYGPLPKHLISTENEEEDNNPYQLLKKNMTVEFLHLCFREGTLKKNTILHHIACMELEKMMQKD